MKLYMKPIRKISKISIKEAVDREQAVAQRLAINPLRIVSRCTGLMVPVAKVNFARETV